MLTLLEESKARIAAANAEIEKNKADRIKARRQTEYDAAQRSRVAGIVSDELPARQSPPLVEPEKEKPVESDFVTRKDVAKVLNGLIKSFERQFVSQSANRQFQQEILRELNQNDFVTEQEAVNIASAAVPETLRGLDSTSAARTGTQLLLAPGGADGEDSAYWGTAVAGISAKGTKTLYYGLFLREYDEDGTIVAIGDEVTPLPAGHTLKLTYDVGRWI